jgi:hypothetical protein
LLCRLARDAEPRTDLSPRISAGPKALDGLPDRVIDLDGQVDQVNERPDITGRDAAAVGA